MTDVPGVISSKHIAYPAEDLIIQARLCTLKLRSRSRPSGRFRRRCHTTSTDEHTDK